MTRLDDERLMKLALAQARRAARAGEVPVGAVIVRPGDPAPLARGHNMMIARHDPTAHAEVVAMRRAGRRAANYRLPGTVLYVTLEPCLLCLGAIVQARMARIVYAAEDPKRGALSVCRKPLVANLLHHKFRVTGGVLAEEAGELLRGFFRSRRLAPPPAG